MLTDCARYRSLRRGRHGLRSMRWLVTWHPLTGNTRKTRSRVELRNLKVHSP